MKPPISLQLYTLREEMANGNHLPILQRIADIGYTGVEGSGYGMTPAEFRNVVNDLGMVVSSCWGSPDEIDSHIETAEALGTDHLVAGFWVQDMDSVDAIKRTADRINAVLPAVQKAGMTYSIHNHWMEFEPVEGVFPVERFLQLCPGLTLELDVYWAAAHGANDPVEMMKRYADRTVLMHMKDGPFTKGEPMVAVGQGSQNVEAIMGATNPEVLKWVIVELDACAGNMLDAVADSFDYLVGNEFVQGSD